MITYVVIKCNNCSELTYIKDGQKSHECRRCGVKNNYEILHGNVTAREAKAYIISKKSKNIPEGFTWQSESLLG